MNGGIGMAVVIILVIFLVSAISSWKDESTLGPIIFAVSGSLGGFLLVITACIQLDLCGKGPEMEARYNALVEKCQTETLLSESLDKELANEIQDWNEEILVGKERQNDFWFGILIPPIYNDCKPINDYM
jgi:hypothetical protein